MLAKALDFLKLGAGMHHKATSFFRSCCSMVFGFDCWQEIQNVGGFLIRGLLRIFMAQFFFLTAPSRESESCGNWSDC